MRFKVKREKLQERFIGRENRYILYIKRSGLDKLRR